MRSSGQLYLTFLSNFLLNIIHHYKSAYRQYELIARYKQLQGRKRSWTHYFESAFTELFLRRWSGCIGVGLYDHKIAAILLLGSLELAL